MTGHAENAIAQLNRAYLRDLPLGAAKRLEAMPPEEVAQALVDQPADAIGLLFGAMAPDVAASLLSHLPDPLSKSILEKITPNTALTILGQFEEAERQSYN